MYVYIGCTYAFMSRNSIVSHGAEKIYLGKGFCSIKEYRSGLFVAAPKDIICSHQCLQE